MWQSMGHPYSLQEKMVKQVNIMDFAIPKKSFPETQKRKRHAEQVPEGQPGVISPLQASPEHTAVRKTTKDDDKGPMESTPCTDTPLQEQSKEDIKKKTRGQSPHKFQPPQSSSPPRTQRLPMETPLPPSPSTPVKLDSQKKETDQSQEKGKKRKRKGCRRKKQAKRRQRKHLHLPQIQRRRLLDARSYQLWRQGLLM